MNSSGRLVDLVLMSKEYFMHRLRRFWFRCVIATSLVANSIIFTANAVDAVGPASGARTGDTSSANSSTNDEAADNSGDRPAFEQANLSQSAGVARDRNSAALLAEARAMIARKQFSAAAEALQSLLDLQQPGFVPAANNPAFGAETYLDLQREANRLLAAMPRPQLDRYEIRFGPVARREFNAARLSGEPLHMREIAVRFRNTRAGLDALRELAAYHFDRGRFYLAATADRAVLAHPRSTSARQPKTVAKLIVALLRSGQLDQAANLLAVHRQRLDALSMPYAGQQVRMGTWLAGQLARASDAAARTAETGDWRMPGGNIRRNAVTNGAMPSIQAVWQLDTSRRPADMATLIDESLSELDEYGIAQLPAMRPLRMGNIVVAKTLEQLIAIDAKTGRVLWRQPKHSDSAPDIVDTKPLLNPAFRDIVAETYLRQIQADTLYGTISSDGERVFSIEQHLATKQMKLPARIGRPIPSDPNSAKLPSTNELVAYRVDRGERIWRIAGTQTAPSPIENTTRPNSFKDVYFLGPPLPHDGTLYVLGQRDTEIRLFVIDPVDGSLMWSLALAEVREALSSDLRRRGTACELALHDGILVCPTGAGAVVAVDVLQRTRRWAYRYPRDDFAQANRLPPGRLNNQARHEWWTGWRDTAVRIDDAAVPRVILTSPESHAIHAIDLHNGESIWTQPQGDGLFVATIRDSKVLVIGKHFARLLDCATGRTLWSSRIDGPSGRGFATATHYFIPLKPGPLKLGGVAAIGLKDGRVQRTFPAAGESVGNLIAVAGGVLAQSHSRISLHPPLDSTLQAVAARAAARPDDRSAQLEHGLLLREARDFPASIAAFEKLRIRPTPTSPTDNPARSNMPDPDQLLRDSLLLNLRQAPARWRPLSEMLRPLIDSTDDRIQYFHAIAQAAARNGQPIEALSNYLQLLGLNPVGEYTNSDGPVRVVRFDRQIQGEILDLLAGAKQGDKRLLEELLDEQLQRAQTSQDPFALQRFGNRFSQMKWGRLVRTKSAAKSGIGVAFIQSQVTLLELAGVSDRSMAASALNQLAEMMDQRSFRTASASYYRRLREEFAGVRVDDDRLAEEVVDQLPRDSLLAATVKSGPKDTWPVTVPTVAVSQKRNGDVYFIPVPMESRRGELCDRLNVLVERQGNKVRFHGASHPGYWELKLPKSRSSFRGFAYNLHRGWGIGQLVVLRLGTELFGISPLDEKGEANARLLWRFDTNDQSKFSGQSYRKGRLGFAPDDFVFLDKRGYEIAQVGPVRAGYLCYRKKGLLVAVDTVTGQRLWQRHDSPANSVATGDDESVLVHSPSSRQIEILRAVDGKTLGVRQLPASFDEFLYRSGRNWIFADGRIDDLATSRTDFRVRSVDITDGHTVWDRRFGTKATAFAIDAETFGVIDRNKRMHVVSRRTGDVISTTPVDVPDKLTGIFVVHDEFRFYVAFSGPVADKANLAVSQIRGGFRTPMVHGVLCGFDRLSAQLLWKRPITDVAFALDQPQDIPFLIFTYRRPKDDKLIGIVKTIDRRTGADIGEVEGSQSNVYCAVDADPLQETIDLQMPTQLLRFDFKTKQNPQPDANTNNPTDR